MSRGWLVVFAKAPRAGRVKTRLSPPLDLDECAELYAAMLADVLEASLDFASRLELLPVLAVHPPEATPEMLGRVPAGYRLHPQRGADLGERMANAFAEAAAAGSRRTLLRGSDSPTLPGAIAAEAVERLDAGDDVVFTPDQGGGYAMVGLRSPQLRLFDVTMSTRSVLDETLAIARAAGLCGSTTAPGFDLDTVDDLRAIERRAPGIGDLDLGPRTVESISTLTRAHVL
jgi:hypothetical protein